MEKITTKQMVAMIIIFMVGNTVASGLSVTSSQNTWVLVAGGLLIMIPFILIYSRICKLYPDKNLYAIFNILFGKVVGGFLTAVFGLYFLTLGAFVVKDLSQFIGVVSGNSLSHILVIAILCLLCVYALYKGFFVVGRFAVFSLFCGILIILFSVFLSFNHLNFSNLQPFFYGDIKEIVSKSFIVSTSPFGEVVIFMVILKELSNPKKSSKALMIGFIGAFILIFVSSLRDILVLGGGLMERLYFPSHITLSILSLNISEFIARIEIFSAGVFLTYVFVKLCICVFAVIKSVISICSIKKEKKLIVPITLIIGIIAMFLFKSNSFGFEQRYSMVACVFQMIIPIIVWIVAEVKNKNRVKIANL